MNRWSTPKPRLTFVTKSAQPLIRVMWVAMAFFLFGTVTGFSGPQPVTNEIIRQRGIVSEGDLSRLRAVMEKARTGGDITVAAIGGSITEGGARTKDPANRYIARVAAWFTKTFPKAKVRFVNAGIGGTNSVFGSMRVKGDVLSHQPDLVIVEYAVNDNHPVPMFWGSYEGVLRQILGDARHPAVIELFFMQRQGENAQEKQQMLGRHYDLPMVSFRDAWWPEIYAGRARWEDMYDDMVHPKDTGHILASELLIGLLEQVNAKSQLGAPSLATGSPLPPVLISEDFAHCNYSQYSDLNPTTNQNWVKSANGKNWESQASDGSITFGFTGKILFVGYDIDKGAESLATFAIDEGAPRAFKPDANRLPIATDLSAGEHHITINFAGSKLPQGSTGKMRIWGVGGAGMQ